MKNNRKKYNLNELVDILSVIENDDGQWGIRATAHQRYDLVLHAWDIERVPSTGS